MPNWCMNDLRITGEEKDILSFIEANKGDDGEFHFYTLVPEPENNDNWYDWRINNWGTKWDTDDVDVQKLDDNNYRLYFTTAWSPPIYWLETAIKDYKHLKFKLHSADPGMNFHTEYVRFGPMMITSENTTFEAKREFWGFDPEDDEFDE